MHVPHVGPIWIGDTVHMFDGSSPYRLLVEPVSRSPIYFDYVKSICSRIRIDCELSQQPNQLWIDCTLIDPTCNPNRSQTSRLRCVVIRPGPYMHYCIRDRGEIAVPTVALLHPYCIIAVTHGNGFAGMHYCIRSVI